jgi:hypothetical protein
MTMSRRAGAVGGLSVVPGLLPLWILFVLLAAPGFMDPVFANPPAFAGVPGGIFLVGAALAVMAVGVVVIQRTSSNVVALVAFVCLTLPSAVVVVMAPTMLLTMASL